MIFKRYTSYIAPVTLLLLGLLLSLPTLQFYAQVSGMWLSYAGMLFLPLVFYIKERDQLSLRFSVLVAACLVAFIFIPSHLILLFGFYCFCFLIIESFLGKLNKLAFVLLVLASPIAYYLFEVFGFPIRLLLTKWAAGILNLSGFPCQSLGNILEVNGTSFSVDPVCMGLNMVMTSMLGSLILISFFEKNKGSYFTNLGLLLSIVAALVFVVIANLFRIVMIVLWKAAPETTLHELLGLISMVLFVFIPLYFFLEKISTYFSNATISPPRSKSVNKLLRNVSIGILLIGIGVANQSHPTVTKEVLDQTTRNISISGYEKEVLKFPNDLEVVALTSAQHLIYIKSQHPYRITNHNPLICWQGSGFEIKNENILEVNQHQVYTAELVSSNDRYFTAWWYDNGNSKMIGNFAWRYKTLKGEPAFRLVNVSARDFSALYMEVEWLLNKNLFIDGILQVK